MPVSARPDGIGSGTDVPDGRRGTTTSGRTVSADLDRRTLVLIVAFWTLFGVFQLPLIGDRYPYPGRMNAIALIMAYLWALLTPPIFWLAAWISTGQHVRGVRVALVVVLGFVVAALAAVATGATYRLLLPGSPGTRPWASMWEWEWIRGQRRWFSREVVTFFVVLVAGVVNNLSRRYRERDRIAAQLQAEQAELRARGAQLQAQSAELYAQLAEARLAMLRTRLNPHFLFNTLNAVSALVGKDPKGVRDMIALLSELLRHALAETREQEIPLHEELRLLRLYLEIVEIRYQGQLRTVVTIDPEVHEALVPNMILQPLVENAMKHGIDRAGGHGTIEVLAHREGDDLVLTVRDSGPGAGMAAPHGVGGVGLRLTRERLAELYGTEQRLEVTPAPGGGMTARVVLPHHNSEDVRLAEEVAHT
jgi:two-component sensor histidine kinase